MSDERPESVDELPDTADGMEAKETGRRLPLGFLVLFFGLIAWGLYYLWAYSPATTGWTQAGELATAEKGAGAHVGSTILYTALPAAILVALAVGMARRKPRK